MKNEVYSLFVVGPESAAEVMSSALLGDVDAQFSAGLMFAEGRGVLKDLVQSFFWLTRAFERGDEDAGRLRDMIAAQMLPAQLLQAEKLLQLEAEVASQLATEIPSEDREIRH